VEGELGCLGSLETMKGDKEDGHGTDAEMTRDQLLTEIWGYDFDGETRTVDVHVRTLRQKLGEKGDLIQTVRGVGYRVGGE